MKKTLILVADGAEEIETIVVADILVRAEISVTIASAKETVLYEGSRGIPMSASVCLSGVDSNDYDLIYMPGGLKQAEFCRDSLEIQDIIENQLKKDKLLAIICASPIALIPRGLAKGRRITSYPSFKSNLEKECLEWIDEKVVVDNNLFTSQSAGTTMDLALALVEKMCGIAKMKEVADSILLGDFYE